MGTRWLVAIFVSGPGQGDFLAFWRNPVNGSLVGVSVIFLVNSFAVRIVAGSRNQLLDLGLLAGGVVGLHIAKRSLKYK